MEVAEKNDVIQTLEEEIRTLRYIVAMMPGHVYWKDVRGNYLGCNKNVANFFKLDGPEGIIGKHDFEIIPNQELAEITRATDLAVMDKAEEVCIEEEGINLEGISSFYLTHKSPLFDKKNKVKGIFGISLDITTQKVAEEKLKSAKEKAEAANRAKSQFLAMVSHELRTPLTSLLGFANLLAANKLPKKKKKEYLEHIINSGSYLHSLINNILDYSKLETKSFKLLRTSFNLGKLIKEIITMVDTTAKIKNLPIDIHYDSHAPKKIFGDSRIIRQILVNLISNAIKFTNEGNVTVEVKLIKSSKKHVTLQIAVTDTGIGIAEDQLKYIFKSFYQVGDVYTRDTSLTGAGLGLAIVQNLTHLIDSEIYVESTLKKGSKFYFNAKFSLPKTKLSSAPFPISKPLKPFRALLVEDDLLIQIVHKKMLEDLNCTVDIADCARNAVSQLSNHYDVLFIDLGLPDTSGFELIHTIRQKNLFQETPIIALTGYSDEDEHKRCIKVGATAVVLKPISNHSLKKILKRYIN